MTRENKAGLLVSSSFVILAGTVLAMKMRESPPAAADLAGPAAQAKAPSPPLVIPASTGAGPTKAPSRTPDKPPPVGEHPPTTTAPSAPSPPPPYPGGPPPAPSGDGFKVNAPLPRPAEQPPQEPLVVFGPTDEELNSPAHALVRTDPPPPGLSAPSEGQPANSAPPPPPGGSGENLAPASAAPKEPLVVFGPTDEELNKPAPAFAQGGSPAPQGGAPGSLEPPPGSGPPPGAGSLPSSGPPPPEPMTAAGAAAVVPAAGAAPPPKTEDKPPVSPPADNKPNGAAGTAAATASPPAPDKTPPPPLGSGVNPVKAEETKPQPPIAPEPAAITPGAPQQKTTSGQPIEKSQFYGRDETTPSGTVVPPMPSGPAAGAPPPGGSPPSGPVGAAPAQTGVRDLEVRPAGAVMSSPPPPPPVNPTTPPSSSGKLPLFSPVPDGPAPPAVPPGASAASAATPLLPPRAIPRTAPIPAGGTSLVSVTAASPRTEHYLVEKYTCLAEDTWDSIADRAYRGAHVGPALRAYNKQNPRASDRLQLEGTIVPGETIFIPSLAILERHGYQPAAPASQPAPAADAVH